MTAPKWPPTITHHRASGQAKVRYRGHDYYLGKYGSRQAQREYAALVSRLASEGPPPAALAPSGSAAKRWTVAEAVARWFAERAPRYDPEGRQVEVIEHAVGPLLRLFPRLPLDELDHERLDEVREDMVARKWCASLILDRIGRIRGLVRWWERKRMAPAGTLAGLDLLEPLAPSDHRVRRAPRRRPCTWEALSAVVEHSPPSVRGLLLVMWWTGCRTGEARRMKAGEIEQLAADVWLFRPARHKTRHLDHERIIPLGPGAREVVAPRLADRGPDEYLWPAIYGGGAASPRVCGPRCYSRHSLGVAVRRARARAGVLDFQPYQCRHAAKKRVADALGLEAARCYLGHAEVQTTLDYASQRDLAHAVDIARRMG